MNKILRFSLLVMLSFAFNFAFADAYKTLTFPDDNKENNTQNGYDNSWTAKIGTDSWTITNFNNYNWEGWTYIRCGRKNIASVGTIQTDFAIDQAIGNVVVTIDKLTASNINSMSLIVASDDKFTNVIETVVIDKDFSAGETTFKVASPQSNLYYKLVFDCAAGSGNGLITISKVEYFKDGDAPVVVDITNTPETAYTVAKANELIAAGEGLATKVYVKGIITSIDEVSTQYGNATYYINDTQSAEGALQVFRGLYLNGDKFSDEGQIKVGDEVIVYGNLKLYKDTNEFDTGNIIYSINNTTGINNNVTNITNSDAPLYNLAGQRVSKSYNGVVIQNGKKFLNK